MLVARRDPIPDHGTQDRILAQPRLARMVSMLQMAGTVVGIPVALASGYSVYHANFSTEAVCQGLRGNIVSMLDKSADAATLRALVRRDVVAFEQNCRSVDPDAVAAFKSLLTVTPAVAKTPAPQPRAEAKSDVKIEPRLEPRNESRNAVREAEPRRDIAKQAPAAKAPIEKPAVARDASLPDDKWIEAVRGALVTHDRAPAEIERGAPPRPLAPPPPPAEARSMPQPAAAKDMHPAPPPAEAAPVPPPPVAVAPPPAPPADADHPVPPAAIPDPASAADASAQNEPRSPSRLGSIMSRIPVLNRVWGEEHHED